MDWFKNLVDLESDPVVMSLTDKEYRAYRAALNDVARNERDGKYFFAGKATPVVSGLMAKGALIPVDSPSPVLACFEVYRWADLMPSTADLKQKRAEAQERKDRWRAKNASGTRSDTRSEQREDAFGSNSTSLSNSSSSGLALQKQEESLFAEFWQAYPRREGKRTAAVAFERALRRAEAGLILAGAARYRDDPNREPQFTAHPATWLNRDGWNDDPLPPRSTSIRHHDRAAEIMKEALREQATG